MKTKSTKRDLLLILVNLIAILSVTSLNADPVMVKCEGVKNEAADCKKGCSVKQPFKVTTLEECKQQGGKPVLIKTPSNKD